MPCDDVTRGQAWRCRRRGVRWTKVPKLEEHVAVGAAVGEVSELILRWMAVHDDYV